jgi:tight adherence protein B
MMFFAAVLAIFTVAMFVAAYYVWSVPEQEAAQSLGHRLRDLRASMRGGARTQPELLRQQHRGALAFLGDLVTWAGVLRRLQELIDQANLKHRAADLFGLSLLLAAASFLVMGVAGLSNLLLRLALALALGLIPLLYVLRMRSRRLRKFEEQLPDAIDLFTRTMRAGHNIHSGLETIANETADPVRMEFRKLMEELALGSQVEPALHSLGHRMPLVDLKFFITSLILQRQTGANMVAVLEGLSSLVRERLNMADRLRAHTAQQRFSAGLLCALPLIFGIISYWLKPDYTRLLWTDPTGSRILTFAVVWEIIGILVIRRIANIRV